jgi:hypothetical protein
MTAITLNLLAEEQQAQEARARDPIKLVTAVGLSVLTVAVAWGGTLSALLMQKRSELQGLESRWNNMNTVGVEEGEFQRLNAFAEETIAENQSRILIAPQLALVKDLIPPSIQLGQLAFAVSVQASGGSGGGDESADSKHAKRQKQSEQLALRLEGTASSSQPELEVDRFLKALRTDARFGALVEDIQLRSISRTGKETDKRDQALAAASFAIECWYKEMPAK